MDVLASLAGTGAWVGAGVGAVWVALAPEVTGLGPGLELTSRGRFSCDVDVDDADVHIVAPAAPAHLSELRATLPPTADLLVVDPRGGCPPDLVTDSLNAGASAFVSGASYRVLVAHVDAVVRRRRLGRR